MRRSLFAALTAGLVLLVTACTAAPAATTPPGGATPPPGGATLPPIPSIPITSIAIPSIAIPSIAIPTLPPGGGTGTQCTAFPTFNPLASPFALPSFAPDPTLEAHFPTQVDGQPVTRVSSGSWLEFICVYAGQAVVDEETALLPSGFNVGNLTFGQANATVDGSSVHISGFRYAGGDASAILQYFAQIAFALSGGRATLAPFTMSTATIGGKTVDVATSADSVDYIYPNGDTIISASGVTQAQAEKIFTAVP